jgi:hypothetical protein
MFFILENLRIHFSGDLEIALFIPPKQRYEI